MSKQSSARILLLEHILHISSRLVASFVRDALGERLDDEGGVIVGAVTMANFSSSAPYFCPRETSLVPDFMIALTVETVLAMRIFSFGFPCSSC